jgi:hypothetical protein
MKKKIMSAFFEISGFEESFIKISIVDRHVSEDWLYCEITVLVPGFRALCKVNFEIDNLKNFSNDLSQLDRVASPSVSLMNTEENFELVIFRDRSGALTVQGKVSNTDESLNKLYFEFYSDQTYIKEYLSSLTKLLKEL